MRYSFAALALAALTVAKPMPQGVSSAISPSGSPLAGCSTSYSGSFEIQVVNVTSSSKRDVVAKRQTNTLVMSLNDGVLKDSKGRTGYIAANHQFQFDSPPQTGAIYTAGWSVCSNGSLAIGPDPIFYQCLSGTFYNLYDESTGAQCNEVTIQAIGGGSATTGVASQTADGQITGSAVASQISDGQVTASAVSSAVCEYVDGQPQVTGCVTQISDGQVQATTGAVSQISDGQVQATTAASAPVTQISDGQVQATTGAPVTQISDGQVQATTGAPVTQISDGQVQASTGAPVSQISDGQIQASTAANGTVSTPTASAQMYTGAAVPTAIRGEFFGLAAGVIAVALL